MIAAVAIIQSDPRLIEQLDRLVTTQIVVAFALTLVALGALGVAIGALIAVRKLTASVDRTMRHLTPRLDPLLTSATKLAYDMEDVSRSVRNRVEDVLQTVDDLNDKVKSGANIVETRMRNFGAVIDVVQSETENLLLDAAATARGVHSAAQVLRAGPPKGEPEAETDEDVFTD